MARKCFPRKLNLTRIRIEHLNRDCQALDPDFQEPIGFKEFTDFIVVPGQINFYSPTKMNFEKLARSRTGDKDATAGKIIFKQKCLNDLGVVLKKGDKVVAIGPENEEFEVNGRITRLNPESWKNGRNLLLVAYFVYDYDERESFN